MERTFVVLSLCVMVLTGLPSAIPLDFGEEMIITTTADGAIDTRAADLDGDGDADVLSASVIDGKLAWYENTDGLGAFGPERPILPSYEGASAVLIVDIDRDEDQDVVAAFYVGDRIAWYENVGGEDAFVLHQILSDSADGAQSLDDGDMNGDGWPDIVAATWENNTLAWYANTDGQGTFGPERVIDAEATGIACVVLADLDGDQDRDIVAGMPSIDRIFWYENLDGLGTYGLRNLISDETDNVLSVVTADLDGDGDLDVLSASSDDDKIAWYENLDGEGSFGAQQVITTAGDYPFRAQAADLDNDEDMDVLSASGMDHTYAWYENLDGEGTFGPQRVISTAGLFPHCIRAADLDRDDDLDILAASWEDDKVAWYRNDLYPAAVDRMEGPPLLKGCALPNPFSSRTTLCIEHCGSDEIALDIHDPTGRWIRSLTSRVERDGVLSAVWNGTDASGTPVAAGLYWCRFRAGGLLRMRPILRLR